MPLPPGTPRSRTPTTALGPESCSETHGNLSPAYLSPPCYHCSSPLCSSRNKPDGPTDGARMLCSTYYKSEILNATWELSLSDKCRDVKPDREHYRKKGLINIYLTQVESGSQTCTETHCHGPIYMELYMGIDFLPSPLSPSPTLSCSGTAAAILQTGVAGHTRYGCSGRGFCRGHRLHRQTSQAQKQPRIETAASSLLLHLCLFTVMIFSLDHVIIYDFIPPLTLAFTLQAGAWQSLGMRLRLT